jgi:hypothetical protein
VTVPPDARTPRAECYHAIRHLFSGAIVEYYRKHPDLLNDAPHLEAASYALLKLMDTVLAKLDEYEIERKP